MILAVTAKGALVTETDAKFLCEMFQYHGEWTVKSGSRVRHLSPIDRPGHKAFRFAPALRYRGRSIVEASG